MNGVFFDRLQHVSECVRDFTIEFLCFASFFCLFVLVAAWMTIDGFMDFLFRTEE